MTGVCYFSIAFLSKDRGFRGIRPPGRIFSVWPPRCLLTGSIRRQYLILVFSKAYYFCWKNPMSYKKIPPSALPESPFLDAPAAAAFLRVSVMWLAKLRTVGGGPPFSKLGGKVLYTVDDLTAWVAERRVKSTAQITYTGKPRGRPRALSVA
jgi:hypothetical protein